jgi:hypothetical protein
MINFRILMFFLFANFSLFSQIKGKVVDDKNQPIPFVNIWVENENIGTTSEENGEFSIQLSDKNKNLIFSALGFEKQIVKVADNLQVVLKSSEIQLDEVVVIKKFATKEIEIGKVKDKVLQAFDNGPKIYIKYFPYLPKYNKTKFINRVSVYTDSKIEDASIKIHFYKMDNNGFPGEELLKKDFIVSVKKGTIKNTFSLENFNLIMPKEGVFVGFEKLLIQKNKIEKTVVNPVTNISKAQISYAPLLMIYRIEKSFTFNFSAGKWNKEPNEFGEKLMISEPAINLILGN